MELVRRTGKKFRAPVVYVNMVGAQDELIYDGGSFAVDRRGQLVAHSMLFGEDLNTVDFVTREGGLHVGAEYESDVGQIHGALVTGIRDFVAKSGFAHVHLGLSGGIDSAVVASLAVDALGPANVTTFLLPSPFTSSESNTLALDLARRLGCETITFPIEKPYALFTAEFRRILGLEELSLVHENMQSRLRGLILMAYANSKNSLLLTTGNKSEYAVGYGTLYGDMCGGLAPIGDLLKFQVYELAKFYNREHEVIPEDILTRAPTAELRPDQTDQDTLPPYPQLDRAVKALVVDRIPARTANQKWVLAQVFKSEFKRWQAPPILRVSSRSFGRGRRFPIAHRAGF